MALNHGKEWSGFKVVEGRSVRKYKDEDAVVEKAKENGYTDIFKSSLITLTEMQKLMGKKKFEELLGDLIIKPKGKPTLVPIFLKALNTLTKVKKTVIKEIYTFIDAICTTTDLEIEVTRLEQELGNIISEMESIIKENAKTAQNQEDYLQRENQIRRRYSEVNSKLSEVENEIKIKQNRKTLLVNFMTTLDGINGEITEFDEDLWSGLIDYILVKDIESYTVVFKNGMAIDI